VTEQIRRPFSRARTVHFEDRQVVTLAGYFVRDLCPIGIPQPFDILKTQDHTGTFGTALGQEATETVQVPGFTHFIEEDPCVFLTGLPFLERLLTPTEQEFRDSFEEG
jgi:hypothetical protein